VYYININSIKTTLSFKIKKPNRGLITLKKNLNVKNKKQNLIILKNTNCN